MLRNKQSKRNNICLCHAFNHENPIEYVSKCIELHITILNAVLFCYISCPQVTGFPNCHHCTNSHASLDHQCLNCVFVCQNNRNWKLKYFKNQIFFDILILENMKSPLVITLHNFPHFLHFPLHRLDIWRLLEKLGTESNWSWTWK